MNSFTKSVLLVAFTFIFFKNLLFSQIGDPGMGGTIKTHNNQPVQNVEVLIHVNGSPFTIFKTGTSGEFGGLFWSDSSLNYTFRAKKLTSEDKYNGVTTFDVSRISKHLTGIDTFTTPSQFLAADVNNDKEIDAIDMLTIRNFILRKKTDLPYGAWRFVDKSYQFINPNNPLLEDARDSIYFSHKFLDFSIDFLAIKYGDVNNTFVPFLTQPQVRNDKSLNLKVEDMGLIAGNEYTIKITADDFNAAAFQGTFSLSDATIKSVKGDLENYGDSNFGLFKNDITTSWNGAAYSKTDVLSITFIAGKNTQLSEILTVNSTLTPAVANDEKGDEMPIKLQFKNLKNKENSFNLLQNTPNPTSLPTNIDFILPTENPAKLTFFTLDGRVILSKNIDGKIGKNSIFIQKSELNNAKGVVFYKLESAGNAATKRMVILD